MYKDKIEVLNYYKDIAPALKEFLKGKEIAVKNWIDNKMTLLKRGSQLEPLYIEEFISGCDDKLLKVRSEYDNLEKAKSKLDKIQQKIWGYFLPRKLSDFFYATNNEHPGKPIERIFFDIDRQDLTTEDSRKVTVALVDEIKSDEKFNELVKNYKTFIMFTGSSFHVYLLLSKSLKPEFYDKHLHFTKQHPILSFTGRWVERIKNSTSEKVVGGHERVKGHINIDPSQTPSGKLARAPFSLHMKDARTVDGIALPVFYEELKRKGIVEELKSYDADRTVKEIDELKKKIIV